MTYDVIFDNVGSTAYPPQLSATVDDENFPTVFTAPFLAKSDIVGVVSYRLSVRLLDKPPPVLWLHPVRSLFAGTHSCSYH